MLTELQKVLRQELKCLCSNPTIVLLEWTVPKTTNVSLLRFNCIRHNTFYRYTVQKCIYAVYTLHTHMYCTVRMSTSGIVSHYLGWGQCPSPRTVLNRNFVFSLHDFDSHNVFQEFYCCVKQGLPVYRKRKIFHGYARSLKCTSGSVLWTINPLNPELNPIGYLLALLGAHHFLHVSRVRVKSLTFRLLMSYIYGAPILDVSRSHTTTQHSR